MRIPPQSPMIFFIVILAYLAGRITTLTFLPDFIPISVDHLELPTTVPVVELTRVEGADIHGSIRGDIRFFSAGQQIIPNQSGAIQFPIEPFLTSYVDILIPDGAQFVASKQGTRFHPVNSAAGNNITLKNRVYFQTREEAEKAGFQAGAK